MKKWEYRIVDTRDLKGGGSMKGPSRDVIESHLNALGLDGWEIINMYWYGINWGSIAGVAKREIGTPESPSPEVS
jgi:hypothetical protein